MLLRHCVALLFVCLFNTMVNAQQPAASSSVPASKTEAPKVPSSSKWYDKISLRGYSQFRYNRLLETNPDLNCEQCDRSIGKNQGFTFRRARLILSGDIHERVFLYLQFDYSADASDVNKHFLQVRDAYADYAFDDKKEFRLRVGQSKVPYGFENLQSSSNRLPLDRVDAFNSAAPNERDMGAFFYYAPQSVRELFKTLVNDGLKGSGDYGVLGFGLYNGQTTNRPELNDNLHAVVRASYPVTVGRQIIEPGLQAYSGKYTIAKDRLSSGVKSLSVPMYDERRLGASFVLYPQPFGIQAEYNIGKGPGFNPASDSIETRNLKGGYVMASWRAKLKKDQWLTPFARYQVYEGGKKQETDARYYDLKETEIGAEWQFIKNLELTLSYVISHRKYSDFKTDYDEKGNFLRVQLQVNY
ncbi:MAG: porin [Bacteroidota bacterium]|jgi:hypothetical protein|nr:OprO/OprP family phosphate-selective porin [Saprospiraceae bacterium]